MTNLTPEWSHIIETEKIESEAKKLSISADEQERKDLARRLDLQSIDSLEADITVEREADSHLIHVTGHFKAQLHQKCVVTLEPIIKHYQGDVEGWYTDSDQVVPFARIKQDRQSKMLDEEIPLLEETEDPEHAVDGEIDIGELVTQFLSLSIDPYPHAEGVAFDKTDEDQVREKRTHRPFAALKEWKRKQDGKK